MAVPLILRAAVMGTKAANAARKAVKARKAANPLTSAQKKKVMQARVRAIQHDRKLSGEKTNQGELLRLRKNIKAMK